MGMFTLRMDLEAADKDGFEALDFRRRHGLGDYNAIAVSSNGTVRFDVEEGFARAWFDGEFTSDIELDWEWLVPGELVLPYENNPKLVQLNPAITVERAKELYVRARFAAVDKSA